MFGNYHFKCRTVALSSQMFRVFFLLVLLGLHISWAWFSFTSYRSWSSRHAPSHQSDLASCCSYNELSRQPLSDTAILSQSLWQLGERMAGITAESQVMPRCCTDACLCRMCFCTCICVHTCVHARSDTSTGIKDALSPSEDAVDSKPQNICDWCVILLKLYLSPSS